MFQVAWNSSGLYRKLRRPFRRPVRGAGKRYHRRRSRRTIGVLRSTGRHRTQLRCEVGLHGSPTIPICMLFKSTYSCQLTGERYAVQVYLLPTSLMSVVRLVVCHATTLNRFHLRFGQPQLSRTISSLVVSANMRAFSLHVVLVNTLSSF